MNEISPEIRIFASDPGCNGRNNVFVWGTVPHVRLMPLNLIWNDTQSKTMDKTEGQKTSDIYVCTFPFDATEDTEPKMDVKQS